MGRSRQELARTCRVGHVGWRDVNGNGQAKGIDEQMPLAPLVAFVTVKAADPGGLPDRFHALRVDDASAGMWILPYAPTFSGPQLAQEVRPQAAATELPEVIIDRLPVRSR